MSGWGDVPLSNNTSTHDNRTRLSESITLIHLTTHTNRILHTPLTRNSIRTPGVNNHRPNPTPPPTLQRLPTNLHRRSLELIRRKHRGSRARRLGRDQREVRELGVGDFHADVRAGDVEALGVGAGGRDELLLGLRDGHFQWCGVVADLAFGHAREG